jgi:tetratricopeptide (TPR) repeat protein
MLVILDNARDAGQVRPLLPGASGCRVLITSRNELTGLIATEGARPVVLGLLTLTEARDMLARRIGNERCAAAPDAVDAIIECCARLPLALAIVAARAATRPNLPLAVLAEALRRARGGLDAFADADTTVDVRAVFSWSYQTLGPAAARLFRLLGLHPGPDLDISAVASLAGLPPERVRPQLDELTGAHLVAEDRLGRYTLHDLLRAYAGEQARAHDPAADRRAAVHRMLDHYLHTGFAAALLLHPHRSPIVLPPPQAGVLVDEPAGDSQAMCWFTANRQVLQAAFEVAASTDFPTHTWQLAWALTDFLNRGAHWHSAVEIQRTALRTACRVGDLRGQAHSHRNLGYAHARLGSAVDAYAELQPAVELFERLDDRGGAASTYRIIAIVLESEGRYGEALRHSEAALDLYRTQGNRGAQASALNSVGWFHAKLGDYTQALACCQQALAQQQEMGAPAVQADTWDSLGYINLHVGRTGEAIACYERSMQLRREYGSPTSRASAFMHLGDAHQSAGDRRAARQAWLQALALLDELDHPRAAEVREKLQR